jgi:hypothetical protein
MGSRSRAPVASEEGEEGPERADARELERAVGDGDLGEHASSAVRATTRRQT